MKGNDPRYKGFNSSLVLLEVFRPRGCSRRSTSFNSSLVLLEDGEEQYEKGRIDEVSIPAWFY